MQSIIAWLTAGSTTRTNRKPRKLRRLLQSTPLFEPLEDRSLLSAVSAVYSVTNSWNSGFQADLKLVNNQSASVSPWKLEFDLPANITSIWNAKVSSHVGNHYTLVGASWDANLPGGSAVDLGFVATGAVAAPSSYLLNGAPLGGPLPPPSPTVSIADTSVVEGNSGTTSAVFTVSLSAAATQTTSVAYATSDGTATAPSDYAAASGTLTFAPGQTKQTITVAVVGDTQVEPDETFFVNLSNAQGAQLGQAKATGTIKNDDTPSSTSGNIAFKVTTDWGSGFTGQITISNPTTAAMQNWQLEFDFAPSITTIWDATVASHVGNHYVIQNAGYNSTIAAGGSVSFGFNGSPGNVTVGPTNYVLHSTSAPPPPPGNPLANSDLAFTTPGQAVTINVLANDSDPAGLALSVAAVSQASHGTLAINADNTIRYTPQPGFTGGDAFTYTLRDASGATATGSVSVTVAPLGTWPAHVFAPYVDMTLYPMYNLVSAAQSQGVRYFSLAFVVADSNKLPAWGGYTAYELGTSYDAQLKSQISGVRALGGDVVVSFGGAAGQELALAITDVSALQRAYQSVIDDYGLTHIDFDIEGAAVADHASIDRRNQAIAALQQAAAAAGKPLDVSFTLPVLPTGLTADGLYVLQSALRYGVNIGNVNVMAMDYGDSAAPNPQGQMGQYAIQAATSLFDQLKGLYGASKTDAQLWQLVGVTPMIGLNDVTSEKFDQTAAQQLEAFAQQKGIGRIAMWSLNRDQESPSGTLTYVDVTSSSIVQQPFEFSKIFEAFES